MEGKIKACKYSVPEDFGAWRWCHHVCSSWCKAACTELEGLRINRSRGVISALGGSCSLVQLAAAVIKSTRPFCSAARGARSRCLVVCKHQTWVKGNLDVSPGTCVGRMLPPARHCLTWDAPAGAAQLVAWGFFPIFPFSPFHLPHPVPLVHPSSAGPAPSVLRLEGCMGQTCSEMLCCTCSGFSSSETKTLEKSVAVLALE